MALPQSCATQTFSHRTIPVSSSTVNAEQLTFAAQILALATAKAIEKVLKVSVLAVKPVKLCGQSLWHLAAAQLL